MRRLSTQQLVPGMVVAADVCRYGMEIFLKKGSVLTDKHITRLELYGILTVYVEDTQVEQPERPPEPVPSYSSKIKSSPEFKEFKSHYEEGMSSFKNILNNVVEKNMDLDVDELLERSLDMITGPRGGIGLLDMLQNMREYDDSTFAHCLNVGLICNIFASWLKMDDAEAEMATACGLLHDVGKLLIPRSIVTKPGKLSDAEYTEIKRHPIEGYKLLHSHSMDESICNSALMHHERCDGTGYPMRLKSTQIDKYAKMVSIADVYDAMTAARVYRGPLCPFEVIEVFEQDGLQKYDAHFLLTFLENVVNTYILNRCRLSDGREGDIIFINKDKLSRPVVQCGTDYVDLSTKPELTITCLL